LAVVAAHIAGALTSLRALMETRTSQGAIAWVVSLNTFPYIAVPAYWVFGRSEFQGYVVARRVGLAEAEQLEEKLRTSLRAARLQDRADTEFDRLLERLAHMSFTRGNEAALLIDGAMTFDAIEQAIEGARSYVLFQFFIIKDDRLGNRLKALLERKAKSGVEVYVLYDEVGSHRLPRRFLEELQVSGVRVAAFNTTQGAANRFQINFRNHRKIVVVDGEVAFVGGHNVGDDYVDGGKFASWRDTHVRLRGPVVQAVQVPFGEDWYWATEELLLNLNWDPAAVAEEGVAALCLPSGPADEFETCTMFFLSVINRARERLWIASPYFVPDEAVMKGLQMASLRGVDVRILLPNDPDHLLVYWASHSYLEPAERAGVEIYRYKPGFMHQKTLVVDSDYAAIGTANLDNRSFRLNFEITIVFQDQEVNRSVASMLEDDFRSSRLVSSTDYTERSLPFRTVVRAARLLAPVL
jgi:cardiolipin synthase